MDAGWWCWRWATELPPKCGVCQPLSPAGTHGLTALGPQRLPAREAETGQLHPGLLFSLFLPPLWRACCPSHFFKCICPVSISLSRKTSSGFLWEMMFLGKQMCLQRTRYANYSFQRCLRKFIFSLFQGAFTFRGSMIDMPLLKQAQNIVTLATAIKKKWAGKWSSRHGAPVAVLKDDYNTWGWEEGGGRWKIKDVRLKQKCISILQICHSLHRIANY